MDIFLVNPQKGTWPRAEVISVLEKWTHPQDLTLPVN